MDGRTGGGGHIISEVSVFSERDGIFGCGSCDFLFRRLSRGLVARTRAPGGPSSWMWCGTRVTGTTGACKQNQVSAPSTSSTSPSPTGPRLRFRSLPRVVAERICPGIERRRERRAAVAMPVRSCARETAGNIGDSRSRSLAARFQSCDPHRVIQKRVTGNRSTAATRLHNDAAVGSVAVKPASFTSSVHDRTRRVIYPWEGIRGSVRRKTGSTSVRLTAFNLIFFLPARPCVHRRRFGIAVIQP